MAQGRSKRIIAREFLLFFALALVGFIAVPLAVFSIGSVILGAFGGDGFSEFFSGLGASLLAGDLSAWFLVLSPYLGAQCLRLAWRTLRTA